MPAPGAALPSAYRIQPITLPSARSIQSTTLLSAYSVQPAACYACSPRPGAQAPSDSIPPYASHPPFATHRASLHAWFPTQLHAMQPSSAQFSTHHTQAPAALDPSAPGARSIPPTIPPGACAIQPTTPKRLQPSPEHPRPPSHGTPDARSLPHDASLGSLAWTPLAYHVSSPDTPTTCSTSDTHAKRP